MGSAKETIEVIPLSKEAHGSTSYQVFKPDIPQEQVEDILFKPALLDYWYGYEVMLERTRQRLEWCSGLRPTYTEGVRWLEMWGAKMDGKW